MQAVILESVSIVAKRNLENLLKDDFEVVQVVRDYGAHAGCDLFLAFFSLCSAFTASSNVLLDGILIACHLVILAGNQASGNASAQLHLSVGDIMLVSNRGSQVRHQFWAVCHIRQSHRQCLLVSPAP